MTVSEVGRAVTVLYSRGSIRLRSRLLAIASLPYVRQVLAGQLPFEWATTLMVSDDPAKGLGRAADEEVLWSRLAQILEALKRELELVSAYFVPGTKGAEYFSALARQGVKVTILTNSLEATDVPAVHAGDAKRRKPMLEAGVVLFEMEAGFSPPPTEAHGPMGSSSASLQRALQWVEQRDGKEIVHDEEPGAGFWLRAFVGVFSMLPIEWLL